jgi:hypothetical protein
MADRVKRSLTRLGKPSVITVTDFPMRPGNTATEVGTMTNGDLPERISAGTPVIVRNQRAHRSAKWVRRQQADRSAYWLGYADDQRYAIVSWDAPLGRRRERVPVDAVRLLSAERQARKQKRRTRLPDDRAESTSVRTVGGGLPEHNRRRH